MPVTPISASSYDAIHLEEERNSLVEGFGLRVQDPSREAEGFLGLFLSRMLVGFLGLRLVFAGPIVVRPLGVCFFYSSQAAPLKAVLNSVVPEAAESASPETLGFRV